MRYRAILSDQGNKQEELDFFIFSVENREYECAKEILKKRPISKTNGYVHDFIHGTQMYIGDNQIHLTIERVKWEITGQDHAAIAVWDAAKWAKKYESLGAKIECTTEDSNPDEASSMKLWKVNWGDLRIALIEPISREETSQVEDFLNKHGDHSFQHIAIGVTDLVEFVSDMKKMGANFVKDIIEREDAFGPLKQIFGCVFDEELGPAAGQFYEFVERPTSGDDASVAGKKPQEFSPEAAQTLFQHIRSAIDTKDTRTFL